MKQSKIPKKRLDLLLVERGMVESRAKAQGLILAGGVRVNGQREDKAGAAIALDAAIEITGETPRYASRAGLKLEGALRGAWRRPHRDEFVSTREARLVDLRIACCSMVPSEFMPWTSRLANLRGSCNAIRA